MRSYRLKLALKYDSSIEINYDLNNKILNEITDKEIYLELPIKILIIKKFSNSKLMPMIRNNKNEKAWKVNS